MNFSNLSMAAVAGGLLGLAGLLYILQRLRIRYSELQVPTTMFWAAAVREAPVRVFRKRFRHFLAYLLSLAIVGLLWLGFAGPETTESRSGGYHVLFLDASAAMTSDGALEEAIEALQGDLSGLPEERREVIWGGAYNLKILDAGEDRLLLDQRLASLEAEAAPSAIDDQLRLLTQEGAYAEQVSFVIYGQAAVSQAALDRLPAGVSVTRGTASRSVENNRGIVSLGVAEAISGQWDSVDVLIRVSGSEGQDPIGADQMELVLGEQVFETEPEAGSEPGTFLLRDLPASGQVLAVTLQGSDGIAADDSARVRLPVRQVIQVALSGAVPEPLWRAIESDPGLMLTSPSQADVVVRATGEDYGSGIAALELSSMASQQAAFAIGYTGDDQAEQVLQQAVVSIGLDQVDHTGLATAAQRPIEATVTGADYRSVALWGELLGEGFNFTQSRSFPIFVAKSIRWLADSSQEFPYLAAGRAVIDRPQDRALGAPSEPAFETLGAEFVPPRAGEVLAADGDSAWPVSLLSAATTRGDAGVALESSGLDLGARAASAGLVTWLILAVLALLALEWVVYRKGLMP